MVYFFIAQIKAKKIKISSYFRVILKKRGF